MFEEITEHEKGLIRQLKGRVQNELSPRELAKSEPDQELYLVRWLRARDLNLDKATDMLRKSLQWRKEKNADEILSWEGDPYLKSIMPFSFTGQDKHGHPVMLISLAEWDFRKIKNDKQSLKHFDMNTTLFYESILLQIWTVHLSRDSKQSPVTEISIVFDCKNYSYGQLINLRAIKRILQMATPFEPNYPQILCRTAFINCPSYFDMLFKMIRPVVGEKSFSKITCYSSISEWKTAMVEWIDPAVLPVRYGGSKNSADE